jgi:hypothetical protein
MTSPRVPRELQPAEWASRERAQYTSLFHGMPKISSTRDRPFARGRTEDVLGVPMFVDRTIQICEDFLSGCLDVDLTMRALARLVDATRSYSVPWNLVGHVLHSAQDEFADNSDLRKVEIWAKSMNRLGSL